MATVCLTFDVDAEAGLDVEPATRGDRLSTLSERAFSVERGLPRILELLGAYGMRATFYVPGAVVLDHPEAIRSVAAAGHEIAHHGHHHLRSDRIDAAAQRAEIEDGLAALGPYLGESVGYRSPAWELTEHTARLLVAHGFSYDSSLMGDDRPYWLEIEGARLLELPIHWSLDDFVWFGLGTEARPTTASAWREAWSDELRSAAQDDRPVTLTFHPEVIGRGYRALALERLLGDLAAAGTEVLTHRELAGRQTTSGAAAPRPSQGAQNR
jgi:peptidoglycan/xylan/chitin deacetylase (PgdA/CDA1 family)